MKKLLSVLLALALMMSLGVGALAYEDLDPPLWQRWGYDSLEEYLEFWEETEEEYAEEVAEAIAERAAQDAFIATYDPETHDFDPQLWAYYGYDSKEEMMEYWEIDEAGYAEAVDDELFGYESRDWTDEQWESHWAAEEAAAIAAEKAELGLMYDVNAMLLDGTVLSFGANEPELRNGCMMVPVSALAAALGATHSYDGAEGKVTLVRGNTTAELKAEDNVLSFDTRDADGSASGGIFYLDALPYVVEGEVWAPLRSVAEALGYEVLWSDTYRTAVLADKTACVAALNKNFTVVNAMLAASAQQDLSQTYAGKSALDLKITLFDSLDGDKVYSGAVNAVSVQNGQAANIAVSFDVKDLPGLLAALGMEPEEADGAELAALTEMLDDGMDMIMDIDGGVLYLRGRLFSGMYGEAADGDTWYSMDMGAATGMEMSALLALQAKGLTVGDLLWMMSEGIEPVWLGEALSGMSESMEILSDRHFTRRGNTWSLKENLTDPDSDFSCVLELAVTIRDGAATTVTGSLNGDYAEYYGLFVDGGVPARLRVDFAISPLKAELTGSFHVKNAVLAEFALSAENEAAPNAEVPAAPPAGAEIVDLFAMIMAPLGVIGGADGPTAIALG